MKKLSLFLFAGILLLPSCSNSQSQSITGVYSGVELFPSMNGAMDREDVTFYLRADKTFTNNVDKPGWKTLVDGNWSVSGEEITFTFSDPKIKPRHFDIIKPDRFRTGGGWILYKMDIANSIPKGVYEFQHASGIGGIGTNTPYVGVSGRQFLYFDGKGNFSQEAEKFVSIIGDNIGGGNNSNKSASGTYQIKEGELTMNFGDGHKTTHSLFVNKDRSRETMAFIDGDAFFLLTQEQIAKKIGNKKNTTTTTPENNTSKHTDATLSAASLIDKIRAKHGGNQIDQLKSMTVTGTAQGLQLKAITDFQKQWTRVETSRDGKLILTEQLEGNSGWQVLNGKKTSLPAARVKEMQADFSAGFAGLRSSTKAVAAGGTIKTEKFGYSLLYKTNGVEMGLFANDKFQIIGEAKQTSNGPLSIVYSDFRNVDGLLIPFVEKHTIGNTSIEVKINDVQINKATDNDFAQQ